MGRMADGSSGRRPATAAFVMASIRHLPMLLLAVVTGNAVFRLLRSASQALVVLSRVHGCRTSS